MNGNERSVQKMNGNERNVKNGKERDAQPWSKVVQKGQKNSKIKQNILKMNETFISVHYK